MGSVCILFSIFVESYNAQNISIVLTIASFILYRQIESFFANNSDSDPVFVDEFSPDPGLFLMNRSLFSEQSDPEPVLIDGSGPLKISWSEYLQDPERLGKSVPGLVGSGAKTVLFS